MAIDTAGQLEELSNNVAVAGDRIFTALRYGTKHFGDKDALALTAAAMPAVVKVLAKRYEGS